MTLPPKAKEFSDALESLFAALADLPESHDALNRSQLVWLSALVTTAIAGLTDTAESLGVLKETEGATAAIEAARTKLESVDDAVARAKLLAAELADVESRINELWRATRC